MKHRLWNLLTLLTVGAALAVSLLRSPTEAATLAALPLTTPSAPAPTPDPIAAYRDYREQTRAREQAALSAILSDPDAPNDARRQAREQLLSLQAAMETELAVEAALAARGDTAGLCVSRQGELTVLLARSLTSREAALLLSLAQEASGFSSDHIRLAAW